MGNTKRWDLNSCLLIFVFLLGWFFYVFVYIFKRETKEEESVDVIVNSECIHLYTLCIVPRCLFQEVFLMQLSHVMPRCSDREFL